MTRNSNRTRLLMEQLETRYVPAAVFTFVEADGDLVKVSASKGTSADLAAATHTSGGQLTLLDLSSATWGTEFAGANVSVAVSTSGPEPADGLINVGEIDATGIDLGAVLVKGDLGKILAGSAVGVVSARSLTANSLGVLGTATGAPDLVDTFAGGLGPLKVQSDVNGVHLSAVGNIASITIGGSLIGGAIADGGRIDGSNVGSIKIGGDIRGGSGAATGTIFTSNAASFTLGGSIFGAAGATSGAVFLSKVSSVKIGGSVVGGSNSNSGQVHFTTAVSVTIGGSITGGSGVGSGDVDMFTVGNLSVGGSLVGGPTNSVAGVISCNTAGTIKLGGDLVGGGNSTTGQIAVGTANSVVVLGSIFGKANLHTGIIEGRAIGSVKVGGSVHGSGGTLSGTISATTLGSVAVGGDLIGASILASGNLTPATSALALAMKSLTVGGSAENSKIIVGNFTNPDVQVGTVNVHGDWIASSLVVGTQNLGSDDAMGGSGTAKDNTNFGDSHDVTIAGGSPTIAAKIAAITIGGRVSGTVGGTDHFGFVAEQIGSFTIGSAVILLSAGPFSRNIGDTGDMTIREV